MSSDNIKNVSEVDRLSKQIKCKTIIIGPITSSRRSYEKVLSKDDNKSEPVQQSTSNETDTSCDIYYGIFVVSEEPKTQEMSKLVTKDKEVCLSFIKQYPGSRFKGFTSRKEALKFSRYGPSISKFSDTNSLADIIRKTNFKYPRSGDLLMFWRAIKNGNSYTVEKCIDDSPLYLVYEGDCPLTYQDNKRYGEVQQGNRYNALLLACLNGQAEICQKILESVSNPELFKRLYLEEDNNVAVKRSRHLLDFYLNTPDNCNNETPLHIACKFGYLSCVKVLLSYIDCDRERKNTNGETAFQVICNGIEGDLQSLKSDIEALFEKRFYVPVFRDEDNCVEASVGSPFSPGNDQSIPSNSSFTDPISPQMKIRGFAGPMSHQQAEKFYARWRYSPAPSGSPKGKIARIRIEDHEKGLERVGRSIASDFNVLWKEYWSFLNEFVDLSTEEGLKKFEEYLKKKYKEVIRDKKIEILQKMLYPDESELYINEEKSEDTDVLHDVCCDSDALCVNMSVSPVTFEEFKSRLDSPDFSLPKPAEDSSETSEDSPETICHYIFRSLQATADELVSFIKEFSLATEMQFLMDGNLFRYLLYLDIIPKIMSFRTSIRKVIADIQMDKKSPDLSTLHVFLITLMMQKIAENIPVDIICILYRIFKIESKRISYDNFLMEYQGGLCEFLFDEKEDAFEHTKCILSNIECGLSIIENQKMTFDLLNKCNCNWFATFKKLETLSTSNRSISQLSEENPDVSAVKNLVSSMRKFLLDSSDKSGSRNVENLLKRFETGGTMVDTAGIVEVYIRGKSPSKEDADVFNAIEDVIISEDRYRRVFRWKLLMESVSNKLRSS